MCGQNKAIVKSEKFRRFSKTAGFWAFRRQGYTFVEDGDSEKPVPNLSLLTGRL